MSIALLPTLFAAVLFGPLAAGLVNAASMLGDPELLRTRIPDRAPRLKLASYTSSRFLTGAAAGLVAQALLGATSSLFGGVDGRHRRRRIRCGSRLTCSSLHDSAPPRLAGSGVVLANAQPTARYRPFRSTHRRSLSSLLHTPRSRRGQHRCSSFPPWLHSGCSACISSSAQLARRILKRANMSVRRGSSRDPREERPVHGWSLEGCCDLLPRHR